MSIEEIRKLYRRYAKLVSGEESELSIGTRPDNFGGRHLEFNDNGKFSLISTDRGFEIKRLETYSIDDLMYYIFIDQIVSKIFYSESKDYDFEKLQEMTLCEIDRISPTWRKKYETEQMKMNDPGVSMEISSGSPVNESPRSC